MLVIQISWILIGNVQVNHILFWPLILDYQLIVLSDLEKKIRSFIKITLTDELKILDDKIKANQTQYDWNREADKISALWSKELGT